MPRYVKKPVEVEAFELTRDHIEEDPSLTFWVPNPDTVPEWAMKSLHPAPVDNHTHPCLFVETREGILSEPTEVGHFIIKGVEGEVYPCDPNIFWKTYDQV